MVVTTAIEGQRQPSRGMRPVDASRDLGSIADLIAEAFSDELDERGRAVLREMRWTARMAPWLGWLFMADPGFQEGYNGFVWEEPDRAGGRGERPQIVGNVSLNRAPGNRKRWIVCNVAVRPPYRRRGIARQLTQAAVDEARRQEAEGVVLQAFRANAAALNLYAGLGFREVAGETELRLESLRPVAQRTADGYVLRPWHPRDGRAAYELARLATPPEQQWMVPLRPEEYGVGSLSGLWSGIGDWFLGRRIHRLAAWDGDRLAALVKVTEGHRRGGHMVELTVHPQHVGRVEAALLSRALSVLEAAPPRPTWAKVDNANDVALDALRDLGFQEKRTLLTLVRDLA